MPYSLIGTRKNADGVIDWVEFLHASGLHDHGHSAAEAAVRATNVQTRIAIAVKLIRTKVRISNNGTPWCRGAAGGV